jgi:hypothetical protein
VAERIDFDYHTPGDGFPRAALAARSGVDWGLEQHLLRIGYWRLPVKEWDPAPEPDSQKEWEQLSAIWGRVGDVIKEASRRDASVGVAYVVSPDDLSSTRDVDWSTAVTEIVPRMRPWGGTVWLAAAEDPRAAAADPKHTPLVALPDGRAFGAAICWWDSDQLLIAPLGADEPAVMPFVPLPVVTIGPAGRELRRPEVHEILVSSSGREPLAFPGLLHEDSRAGRMGALACRLALIAVSLLDKLQAEQRVLGNELGKPPAPFKDPVPHLPVRPRLLTDLHELADAIVEIWVQGDELCLEAWQKLDRAHHGLFAGRDLTPRDYAAVEEAHWRIYGKGSNIYCPDSWHQILKGGNAPPEGWCEPWFPEAQRSATERYARNPTLDELLPGGRIPADADPAELRRNMPFAFNGAPIEVFVEFARDKDVGPQVARYVLSGGEKASTPWWHDVYVMLGELLAPYRPGGDK